MSARRILVAYGTRYGHTARIAARIADHFAVDGTLVTLVPADDLPLDFSPHDYDAIVLGASVIGGKHQRSARRFAARYGDALNAMPSAFFSVSGSAGSVQEGGRKEAWRMLEDFLREAAWRPRLAETFGGAIAYTKYPFFLRWVMKRITAKNGGPTDTTRDHVLTDWARVERFARMVAEMLPQPAERPPLALAGP